jgi:hypothetical protein
MATARGSSLGDVRRLFQPDPPPDPAEQAPTPVLGPAGAVAPRGQQRPRKVRATFHVSADVLDEAKDAVVALMGPPLFLTLSDLLDQALRHEVDRLRQTQNDGQPFASRPTRLRGGRPIGS